MIIAFFTPYYKFLQKGNYLKFFNNVDNLSDLMDKIKVEDKIKIYAHSKDIIKFQFGNTNSQFEYEFLADNELFDDFISKGDRVKCKVKDKWQKILGEYVYLIQDRDKQIQFTNDVDMCSFQATDINILREGLFKNNQINEKLLEKMFFTDEQLDKHDKGMVG